MFRALHGSNQSGFTPISLSSQVHLHRTHYYFNSGTRLTEWHLSLAGGPSASAVSESSVPSQLWIHLKECTGLKLRKRRAARPSVWMQPLVWVLQMIILINSRRVQMDKASYCLKIVSFSKRKGFFSFTEGHNWITETYLSKCFSDSLLI